MLSYHIIMLLQENKVPVKCLMIVVLCLFSFLERGLFLHVVVDILHQVKLFKQELVMLYHLPLMDE